jgi:hypothetical protein
MLLHKSRLDNSRLSAHPLRLTIYKRGRKMGGFSIGEAWSQAMAFMTENLQMLAVVVGGGALLAAVIQYLVVGGDQMAQFAALQSAISSGDFSQLAEGNAAAAGMGAGAGLVAIVASIIQSGAEFAGVRIGLSRGQEDIGSALSYGVVAAILSLLLFIAIGIVAALVIGVPLVLLGVGAGLAGGGSAASMGGIVALIVIVAIVVALWLAARLSVMQPAMAAARSTNPIYGLTESWRLTRGHALMIVLYLILLGIAAIVIFAIVGAIVGVLGAIAGPFVSMLLTTIIVGIPVTILFLSIGVGIYRTLAPDNSGDVFA